MPIFYYFIFIIILFFATVTAYNHKIEGVLTHDLLSQYMNISDHILSYSTVNKSREKILTRESFNHQGGSPRSLKIKILKYMV